MAFASESKKESTIFLKNLPDDITTEQLENSLDEYGPVRRAIIVKDKQGVSRGFGYVEFVMPEDAEEAAKKLNHKEFFGKVVHVEVAKPKKREKAATPEVKKEEKEEKKPEESKMEEEAEPAPKEEAKPVISEEKQEEIAQRLRTIVIFGIPRQMSIETLTQKLNPIINKKNMIKKGKRLQMKKKGPKNTIEWPVTAPFNDNSSESYGIKSEISKPVAHVIIAEENMKDIKEIVKDIEESTSYFARRMASIPINRLNFEKCRMIVRNLPFNLSEKKVYNLFSTEAPIHSITFPHKEEKGQIMNKGYCFIQYYCGNDVETEITKMNGSSINNRVIVCDQSVSKAQYLKQQQEEEEEEKEQQEQQEQQEQEKKEEEKDDDDDDDKKMEEEPAEEEKKKHERPSVVGDADEGKTLFIRNIPMDATQKDLFRFFKHYGKIVYVKLCVDKISTMSKGTGFIKFEKQEDADALLAKYEAISTAFQKNHPRNEKKEDTNEIMSAKEEEENLVFRGRKLLLSRAITQKDLKETLTERELSTKDNRNLYLLEEGVIDEEHKGDMNTRDFEKRKTAQKEKMDKLKNPLFFVNPTRLLVKNLGPHITSNYLKQICIDATKQGLALNLVNTKEIKLQLRPTNDVISKDVKITQSIVPRDDSRSEGKAARGFGFVEFKDHVHALACLRYLNNNPLYSWACFNAKSLVDLYEHCGETIANDPHVLAKLNLDLLKKMKLPSRKNGESASRLIVEFAISNHNVLRQKEQKGRPKKVEEVSVTQEKKEKKETFDLKKNMKKPRQHFAKHAGKIRNDYERNLRKKH